MTILIKEIRPPVISEELAAELDDYLSFRHIFRSIYGFELKGERLEREAQRVLAKVIYGYLLDNFFRKEFAKR